MEINKLSDLPNIGQDTERLLHEVGIHTFQELREVGAKQAWLKIQQVDPSACYNRLLGLEGAIQGINKKYISVQEKADLKEFYCWHRQRQSTDLC